MTVLAAFIGPYPYPIGDDSNTYDRAVEVLRDYDAELTVIDDGDHRISLGGPGAGSLLGGMRNAAADLALDGGYSHLLLMDNDAVLAADTLNRLMAHGVDIVAPRFAFATHGFDARSTIPRSPSVAAGLWPIQWTVLAAVLFSRRALEAVHPLFWLRQAPLVPRERLLPRSLLDAHDERRVWQHWHEHGLETYTDLDTPITVLTLPYGWQVEKEAVDAARERKRLGRMVAALDTGLLTEEQQGMLELVTRGLTDAQIAGELSMEQEVVEDEMADIYRRLGLSEDGLDTRNSPRVRAVFWWLKKTTERRV